MVYLIISLFAVIIIFVIVIIFQWVYLPKYFEKISHSRWMSKSHLIISLFLLLITLSLAIFNLRTYQKIVEYNVKTIDNYKARNRPFIKIEPIHIDKEKKLTNIDTKELNRPFVKIEPIRIDKKEKLINIDTKELNTPFYPKFKLKNYGQFPAFIESIDVWIEDEPKDLLFPKGSGDMNTENFALFQGEETKISKWMFLLGDSDIEKIKKIKNENNQVYFVFKIIYKILSDDKSLQKKPFVYWAKYKCDNPTDNQIVAEYSFDYILECGTNDIKPNI